MGANVALVRAWVRALNERDEDRVVGLVSQDFQLVEPRALPGAGQVHGRDGLRRYAAGWSRNWSEWTFHEVEIFDASPTQVIFVADLELRGRNSGAHVQHRWVYLVTIRDGEITSQIGFDDRDDALEAARTENGDGTA